MEDGMGDAQRAERHSDDSPRHGTELPEACVTEALAIIRDVGIENLSLREVARRLGVSHQAPYRHFPSRDHLLAEVVDRCFRDFDAALGTGHDTGIRRPTSPRSAGSTSTMPRAIRWNTG
jgi:AcrR family transcriptional regulator